MEEEYQKRKIETRNRFIVNILVIISIMIGMYFMCFNMTCSPSNDGEEDITKFAGYKVVSKTEQYQSSFYNLEDINTHKRMTIKCPLYQKDTYQINDTIK